MKTISNLPRLGSWDASRFDKVDGPNCARASRYPALLALGGVVWACSNYGCTSNESASVHQNGAEAGPVAGTNSFEGGLLPINTGGSGGSSPDSDGGRTDGADGASANGPACGDGLLNQLEERCDDGNRVVGDGCSGECRIEANHVCITPGQTCTSTKVCGDGILVGDETCDDGPLNQLGGDGCSVKCRLEPGFACPLVGAPCREICGDGLVVGRETCDDRNVVVGDGCSSVCRLERTAVTGANGRPAYWNCSSPGVACVRAICGDGKKEGAEPCDDGNDRPGDACSPDCTVEPKCTAGGCQSQCGDGMTLPGETEECDDGNATDGDGCSAKCTKEAGYQCQQVSGVLPNQLVIPIVYRDFIGKQRAVSGTDSAVHPDFESTVGTGPKGLVKSALNATGVPELTGLCVGKPDAITGLLTGATDSGCPMRTPSSMSTEYRFNQMSSNEAFAQWFQDVPAVNQSIVSQLCLKRQGTTDTYVFDSAKDNPSDCGAAKTCETRTPKCWFLPINDKGFVAAGREIDNLPTPDVMFGSPDPVDLKGNFGFTSVVRTWFIYNGGEQLQFSGDDDVWVFINGQLAVDLGGLHSIQTGAITLDATQAPKFGLTSGHVYEMVLFHAERYGYGSNFKLTLTGFLAAKSQCQTVCGDGIRAGSEACDHGAQNVAADSPNAHGRCTKDCTLGPRCGDGLVQKDAGEECDEPSAQALYTDTPGTGCTPGCRRPGYCGDGVLQTGIEACDDGAQNVADGSVAYAKCTSACRMGPHCGDGIRNGDEACDEGPNNGLGGCSIGCQIPPIH